MVFLVLLGLSIIIDLLADLLTDIHMLNFLQTVKPFELLCLFNIIYLFALL